MRTGARRRAEVRDEVRHLVARRRLARRLADLSRRGGPLPSTGVVAHVWYPQEWAAMRERVLAAADGGPVVLTVPDGAPVSAAERSALERDGLVVDVPNRGRDVLPFLRLLPALADAGVEAVLKVHTKRSVHSDVGAGWLATTLDELLGPSRPAAVAALRERRAVLVGPRSFHYPLSVALDDNRAVLERELVRALGSAAAAQALAAPDAHGFFAGTMFWTRPEPVAALPAVRAWHVAAERGQVNGTTAHALERVLTLVARREGEVWSMGADGLGPQRPDAWTLPAWARADPPADA